MKKKFRISIPLDLTVVLVGATAISLAVINHKVKGVAKTQDALISALAEQGHPFHISTKK